MAIATIARTSRPSRRSTSGPERSVQAPADSTTTLHPRNTFAASAPVLTQPRKRTRLVARLPSRIANTWCDGYASPTVHVTITEPAIATMVPPKHSDGNVASIERRAAGRQHCACESR